MHASLKEGQLGSVKILTPSLSVNTKDRSRSTTTPNQEYHNMNGEMKDVEAIVELRKEWDEVLEPGGV